MRLTALLLALAVVVPAPAQAAEPPGPGRACDYSVVNQADLTADRWVGYLYGGPYVIGGRTGRLTCSIQVGGTRHADPDAVSVTSLTTSGVVVLPPTPVELVAGVDDTIVLCTQVEIDGEGTYYWDPDVGEWSTDQAASCGTPVPDPPEPELRPIDEVVFDIVDPLFVDHVDPVLCPALAALAPGIPPVAITPEGDVAVAGEPVFDCPPYESAS